MKRILFFAGIFILASAVLYAQDTGKKEATGKKKSKSTNEYIADLNSKDDTAIIEACDYLGEKKEKKALPQLMELLKENDNAKVRLHAAIALGLIGDEKSVDVLNESLINDSNADVRYSVILAISRIGSTKSISALKTAKQKESDPYIKDFIQKIEEKFKKK